MAFAGTPSASHLRSLWRFGTYWLIFDARDGSPHPIRVAVLEPGGERAVAMAFASVEEARRIIPERMSRQPGMAGGDVLEVWLDTPFHRLHSKLRRVVGIAALAVPPALLVAGFIVLSVR